MQKTPFSALSQTSLGSRFQSQVWDRLPYEARLSLCQEMENRLAARQGLQPRTITAQPMENKRYGVQRGDTIVLNSHLLRDGVFRSTYLDANNVPRTFEITVPAAGWNLYDTICHEHTHGVQWDEGRAQTYVSYISPNRDYPLYRIQPDEREAFAVGQKETLEAIARVEAAIGRELPEKANYLATVREEAYEPALARAQMCYGDPGVQEVLDQVVFDRENGVTPDSPSLTYTYISEVYQDPGQDLAPEAHAPTQDLEDDGSAVLNTPGSSPGIVGQDMDDGSAALSGQSAGPSGGYGGLEGSGQDPSGGIDPA